MPISVTQTSAAKIVRASRVSESDRHRLVADFGLHPLDAERLLTVPERSGVERYHDYLLVSLLLPWPTAKGLVSIDLRIVISPKFLIVVGDVPAKTVARWAETIDATDSRSVPGQAVQLLLALSQAVAQAVHGQQHQPAVEFELAGLRLALETFDQSLDTLGLPLNTDQRQQLALARHHLHQPAATLLHEAAPAPAAPNQRAVVGYVAVTAAVLLVTLLFRP